MKRIKKIIQWTGIILGGLVAIVLVANAVFVWTTDTRLERQLRAIREAGDPLTLAELAPEPIPPEKNAATYLRRAKAGVDAIIAEVTDLPGFWKHFETREPMPEQTEKNLKDIFSAYPDVIPLLRQAADCPDYDAQLDYTLPPMVFFEKQLVPVAQDIRATANVLQVRVRLLIAEEKYDEALQTALILFRLANHCDRNPGIFSYLVASTLREIAVDSANLVLQTGPVSKESRLALDAELARQESVNTLEKTIKQDRVFSLAFCGNYPYRKLWFFMRGRLNLQESQYLDMVRSFLDWSQNPDSYRKAKQTIDPIHENISVPPGLFDELFVGLNATYNAAFMMRANMRCLRVHNALQAHMPTGNSEKPKLGALGLPVMAITDPYTGKPLIVKKLPRGWLVYSVGRNLQDDDGKRLRNNWIDGDVGVGPPPAAKPAKEKGEDEK